MCSEVIKTHRDLIVWQKSMDLVSYVYKITGLFPASELYGLVSQMRKCAISIPSNIAEGRRRGTRKDYRSFLLVSFGSGAELEAQLEISRRLSFCSNEDFKQIEDLLSEVMKMLNKMIESLKKKSVPTSYQLPATS